MKSATICSTCGSEKVITSSGKLICRKCSGEAYQKWRAEHPEKAREASRKWRANNPEKAKTHSRKWNAEHPEKMNEASQRWREKNPEQIKEAARKWQKDNPERVKEASRKWRAEHPEQAKEARRKCYANRSEQAKEAARIAARTKCIDMRYLVETGIKRHQRSKKYFHRGLDGYNIAKTKKIAFRDISECEQNYIQCEAQVLNLCHCEVDFLNIDDLLENNR